ATDGRGMRVAKDGVGVAAIRADHQGPFEDREEEMFAVVAIDHQDASGHVQPACGASARRANREAGRPRGVESLPPCGKIRIRTVSRSDARVSSAFGFARNRLLVLSKASRHGWPWMGLRRAGSTSNPGI